jgi:hypothetical protein
MKTTKHHFSKNYSVGSFDAIIGDRRFGVSFTNHVNGAYEVFMFEKCLEKHPFTCDFNCHTDNFNCLLTQVEFVLTQHVKESEL